MFKKQISAFHMNISSLAYHIDDLNTLLSLTNINFDFIGITETKIKRNQIPLSSIEITNYNIEQCDTESSKGGALLYIHNKHSYKKRNDLKIYKPKELESVFVEILNPGSKNIVVGCIYKHPTMTTPEFMDDYLSKTLEFLSFENKHLILLGDFNINLLNCETDKNTNDFLDLLTSNSLLPLILRPTRVTTHSKTLIDNIFTNIINHENISGNITCSISDHLAQFTIFKMNGPKYKNSKNTKKEL